MQRNHRAAKRRLETDAKKSALTYRGPKRETCTIPGGESRGTVAKGSKGAPVTLGRAGCPHNHPRGPQETRAAGSAPAVALLSWVSRSGTRGAIWGLQLCCVQAARDVPRPFRGRTSHRGRTRAGWCCCRAQRGQPQQTGKEGTANGQRSSSKQGKKLQLLPSTAPRFQQEHSAAGNVRKR